MKVISYVCSLVTILALFNGPLTPAIQPPAAALKRMLNDAITGYGTTVDQLNEFSTLPPFASPEAVVEALVEAQISPSFDFISKDPDPSVIDAAGLHTVSAQPYTRLTKRCAALPYQFLAFLSGGAYSAPEVDAETAEEHPLATLPAPTLTVNQFARSVENDLALFDDSQLYLPDVAYLLYRDLQAIFRLLFILENRSPEHERNLLQDRIMLEITREQPTYLITQVFIGLVRQGVLNLHANGLNSTPAMLFYLRHQPLFHKKLSKEDARTIRDLKGMRDPSLRKMADFLESKAALDAAQNGLLDDTDLFTTSSTKLRLGKKKVFPGRFKRYQKLVVVLMQYPEVLAFQLANYFNLYCAELTMAAATGTVFNPEAHPELMRLKAEIFKSYLLLEPYIVALSSLFKKEADRRQVQYQATIKKLEATQSKLRKDIFNRTRPEIIWVAQQSAVLLKVALKSLEGLAAVPTKIPTYSEYLAARATEEAESSAPRATKTLRRAPLKQTAIPSAAGSSRETNTYADDAEVATPTTPGNLEDTLSEAEMTRLLSEPGWRSVTYRVPIVATGSPTSAHGLPYDPATTITALDDVIEITERRPEARSGVVHTVKTQIMKINPPLDKRMNSSRCITTHDRVHLWFGDASEAFATQGYCTPGHEYFIPEEQRELRKPYITFVHAASPLIDNYLQQHGIVMPHHDERRREQRHLEVCLGVIIKIDDQPSSLFILTYSLAPQADGSYLCYHRALTQRSKFEFVNEFVRAMAPAIA